MHGISHKGLMKAIVAIALVAIMVATPFGNTQAHAQQPAQTRADQLVLRVAMQDDIKTLNYLSAGDVWTWNVIGWMFDGLTWRNSSNNDHIEPWAAVWFHHGLNSTWSDEPYADHDNNTDYRNWTVKLRSDVKWHDWKNQTGDDQFVRAHDVIFSMRLVTDVSRYAGSMEPVVARDADGNMIYGRDIKNLTDGIYKGPKGDWPFGVDVSSETNYPNLPVILVTADSDDLTIHYTLTKTYADFTTDTVNPLIVPERIWKNHISDKTTWSDPQGLISFGPFKFGFWDSSGQQSKILTFRDYFRPEYDPITGQQKPYIDAILFKIYGTTDAAVMALTGDKVDYIAWAIDPGFIDTINGDPHLTLVRNSDLGFFYVAFNMRKPEFGYQSYNPDDVPSTGVPAYTGNYTDVGKPFRVAFSHIIDKQYIVSKFLQGFGSVGTSVVSPVNSFWYNPNIKIYSYDPDEANRILDEYAPDKDGSGWRILPNKGSDEITMMTPPADYDPIRSQSGLLIQQDAQKVGINLKSVPTNFGTIVQKIGSHDFDMYMLGWSIPTPMSSASAPCDFFGSKHDGGGNNYPGYHNQSFDKLCDKMNSELDINKRKETSFQLQKIIADDVPYSVLYYRDVLEAYNNQFTGWVPRYGSIFNWYSLKELRVQPESKYKVDLSTPTTINGGSQVTFTAYVTDKTANNDPVPGISVTFQVDNGTLSSNTQVTDANGKAEVTYNAPSPDKSLGVTVLASVHDPDTNTDIRVTKFVTVIHPTEITLNVDVVPNGVITAKSGVPTNFDISVTTGTGETLSPLNANWTGAVLDFQISPEGASQEFVSYDSDGWHYHLTGIADAGKTVQYTVTVTVKYLKDNVTVSSANKGVTMTVVGPEPPPPEPTKSPSLGVIPVLFAVSFAAVVYNVYRKKH